MCLGGLGREISSLLLPWTSFTRGWSF